uniref:Uncharacterized protein n=1 Tax=Denticeps clupeoides TaxID=299321 RepID=A0AAY4E7Q7_9TELE
MAWGWNSSFRDFQQRLRAEFDRPEPEPGIELCPSTTSSASQDPGQEDQALRATRRSHLPRSWLSRRPSLLSVSVCVCLCDICVRMSPPLPLFVSTRWRPSRGAEPQGGGS